MWSPTATPSAAEMASHPDRPPAHGAESLPLQLTVIECEPSLTRDERAKQDYLGSPRWTGPFARYMEGVQQPWWRHDYIQERFNARHPAIIALAQRLEHCDPEEAGDVIEETAAEFHLTREAMGRMYSWALGEVEQRYRFAQRGRRH